MVKREDDLNLKDKDNLKFDKMEDNLSFFAKWKILIIKLSEDNLNFLNKMEDDLIFLQNGRQPKLSGKWKMTLILR